MCVCVYGCMGVSMCMCVSMSVYVYVCLDVCMHMYVITHQEYSVHEAAQHLHPSIAIRELSVRLPFGNHRSDEADGCVDEWMGGMNGWMDGWMDG